jgi:hypothetical protein
VMLVIGMVGVPVGVVVGRGALTHGVRPTTA